MKFLLIFAFFLLFSCQSEQKNYSFTILDAGVVDSSFVTQIDEPGRILLGWYLYAYGNECDADNEKPKCKLLNLLSIDNECDKAYIASMRLWFEGDIYRSVKLKNCPSLPLKGAIQNEFKYITIERTQDTLSVGFRVDGMNNAQEKSWNVERVERFLIQKSPIRLLSL